MPKTTSNQNQGRRLRVRAKEVEKQQAGAAEGEEAVNEAPPGEGQEEKEGRSGRWGPEQGSSHPSSLNRFPHGHPFLIYRALLNIGGSASSQGLLPTWILLLRTFLRTLPWHSLNQPRNGCRSATR
jgi:hypothetical protein